MLESTTAAGLQDEVRASVTLLDADTGAVVGELAGIRYAPAARADAPRSTDTMQQTTLRERLLAAVEGSDGGGEAAVLAYLRETACAILRFQRDRPLDPRQPLPEMGFDSIMGVWFRNRLQTEIGVDIEPKEFLREPTLAGLASAVMRQLARSRETTGNEPGWVEGEL